MSEHDTDSFYWELDPDFPVKQGDLLLNVPLALMPSQPEFVVRPPGAGEAEIVPTDGFPEVAPTTEIVAEARFGALSMIIAPTCHVSEGEKDEDVVAVVPVEPLRVVVPNRDSWEQIKKRPATRPHHLFYLPPTDLGGGVLVFDAVAQLDRPGSFLKHELRNYRRRGSTATHATSCGSSSPASGPASPSTNCSTATCRRRSTTTSRSTRSSSRGCDRVSWPAPPAGKPLLR
jgi:hypothetical protein